MSKELKKAREMWFVIYKQEQDIERLKQADIEAQEIIAELKYKLEKAIDAIERFSVPSIYNGFKGSDRILTEYRKEAKKLLTKLKRSKTDDMGIL